MRKTDIAGDDRVEKEAVPLGRTARSLPELVAAEVLQAIRQEVFKPGERLKEEVLAEQYAVSRSTVREAISLLEQRGVVERLPRYGARVVAVDQEELEEIFAIRVQLLGLAARLVAENATDHQLDSFVAHVAQLETLASDPDIDAGRYAEASIEAQRLLISAWKGKRLRAMYEKLSDVTLWRFAVRDRATSFRSAERRRQSASDWRKVAEALVKRDAEGAERSAKELLQASYLAVKKSLQSVDE